jgi:hypothetical protein
MMPRLRYANLICIREQLTNAVRILVSHLNRCHSLARLATLVNNIDPCGVS